MSVLSDGEQEVDWGSGTLVPIECQIDEPSQSNLDDRLKAKWRPVAEHTLLRSEVPGPAR